jgi:DNA-binding NarL/FixJ family response regulator
MKNEPFKFIKYSLSQEAMKSISAGAKSNSSGENHISDMGNHLSNSRDKKIPKTLQEAYRRLSRRECEVLEKIVKDKTNREIADELFISRSTVGSHITRIGKVLGLQGWGILREWINKQQKSK